MVKNMGTADRVIRAILGVAAIALAYVFGGWVWIAGVLGFVFLATSAISFCPLYKPFKLSTRKKPEA